MIYNARNIGFRTWFKTLFSAFHISLSYLHLSLNLLLLLESTSNFRRISLSYLHLSLNLLLLLESTSNFRRI